MTESPFVKAEGPEPPDVVDFLGKEHQEAMAKVNATILEQLQKHPIVHTPENTAEILVDDSRYGYAYAREQKMQPDMSEIERVRAEVYRAELELSRQRYQLTQAEIKLVDAYQLIGQLVGYLDSIEWGTHDEWTRSQALRERAHEYLTASNTIAT